MNKLIKRLAMLSVGLTMAIGAGIAAFGHGKGEVAKAAEGDTLATFSSADVVTASGYNSYSDDNWNLNIGGNNLSAGWNKNASNARQVGETFAIDSTSVTATTYGWVASTKSAIANAGKLVFSYTGGSGNGSGLLWLGYSTDGGTTYSKVTLTVGTQGSSCGSTNTEYTFEFDTIESAKYAIIVTGGTSGSAFRFDSVTAVLKEGPTGALKDMSIFNSSDDETPFELDYGPTGMLLYARESVSSDDLDVDWTTSDATILDIEEIENDHLFVKGLKPGTATVSAEREEYKKATATITVSAGDLETIVVSGAMSKTSYSTMESWSAAGLVATANYELGYSYDATEDVEWTFNPAAPAENVTSVVATATMDEVSGSSAAQAVTVTVAHAGTEADPFTVAEALAKANEIGTAGGSSGQGPWVTKGIITRVTSAPVAPYWNATYFISDTGDETNELQVYRGFYLNGAKFDDTTKLLLKEGNIVTITGNLTGSYGCEYCANNHLLSIEEPETGDIEVTFEPASTSFEIGATGTFTATADMEGCTFAWESNNEDVLSVDENTGAFETLALGTAKITVTATKGDKEGVAFVNMTVNGAAGSPLTVAEAVALAASLDNGKTTSYYVYVEGYVKEFATSMKDSKPRAFDIMSGDEASRIMVYTNVDPYTDFVSDLALGHYVKVKANVQNYSGTYELTSPEKISSAYSALSLAYELLSLTDEFCEGYDGVTDNKSLVVSAWETLSGATKYGSLSAAEIAKLVEADAKEESKGGTILEQAMARYDYLNDKYELEGFIVGRGGSGSVENRVEINNNNSLIVVIAVISAVSLVALSTLLVLKKKHK